MKNPWKIEKRQFTFDIIWEEWKTHWPSGQSTRLRVERSGFETCAGSMCYVLRQNTLPPQCFSSLRSIDGYRRIVTETWWNARGLPCNGPITHPGGGGGSGNTLVASLHGNRDKLQLGGPMGLITDFAFNKRWGKQKNEYMYMLQPTL